MKKIISVGIFIFSFSVVINAQENKEGESQKIKLYKVENTSQSNKKEETTSKFKSAEEEIAWCENQIAALDKKEEWIRNNPEETRIAEEEGWFTKAEATRAELRARIKELQTTK